MTDMSERVAKEAWVVPEIRELSVDFTEVAPNRGADGQFRFIDCTRS